MFSRFPRLLIGSWALSLLFMVLTLSTPLEFSPLPVENIFRWGVWLLAFPACRQLYQITGRLPWLWKLVPWLLWSPVLFLEGFVLLQPSSYPLWKRALEPVEFIFWNRADWDTKRVLFRRGNSEVAFQHLRDPRMGYIDDRLAYYTPLLPGVHWASPIPGEYPLVQNVIDTSWQIVDTASAELSQDMALRRSLQPWLTGQRYTQRMRELDAWRQKRGLSRTDTPEALPPVSQQGAHTMGCRIQATGSTKRASFWLPPTLRQGHGTQAVYRSTSSEESGPKRLLTISTNLLLQGQEFLLVLHVPNVRGPGTYTLTGTHPVSSKWSTLYLEDATNGVSYTSWATPAAVVQITRLDTTQCIVAGSFFGELRNGDVGDCSVTLDHGRFDLLFQRE
ncbi:hypothetical protein DNI29_23055 [Hymenobacter sediminis]|uniref:hypothetical protein n=1 Tax=Hymenobacter sediminis TaxID=2218621 RepID=UPI000DA6B059|nr:hypothetical protein [Hymenobacter sediminis]RPD43742.1 hypothetical protein DNI29_23055 [Hymenobacter sediminis]